MTMLPAFLLSAILILLPNYTAAAGTFSLVGKGKCQDDRGMAGTYPSCSGTYPSCSVVIYDYLVIVGNGSLANCETTCRLVGTTGLVGMEVQLNVGNCYCLYEDGTAPPIPVIGTPPKLIFKNDNLGGTGPVTSSTSPSSSTIPYVCYKFVAAAAPPRRNNGKPRGPYGTDLNKIKPTARPTPSASSIQPTDAGTGVVAAPVMVPVGVPVMVPVSAPVATTVKGPKAAKKAKAPSASKGSKLVASKFLKRRL